MRKKIICVLVCILCAITTVLPTMGKITDCEKPDKSLMEEETNLPSQNNCAFSGIGNDTDNQKLTSPIDLSSVSTTTFTFYIQYAINSLSLDRCYVHIEIDGGAWNKLDEFNGYQHDWLEKSYDLSSMVDHNIRIRFRYHTGLNSTSEGAYIDRITMIGDGVSIYEEDFEGYEIGDPWEEWIVVEKPGPNHPPYIPSNPNPANGSTYVNVNTDLSWTGGDPDPDDSITYNVYFGIDPNPPNVAIDIANTTYMLDRLNYNTQYYWRIDAWDSFDNSTTGTTWTFYTAENNPPYIPSNPNPANGSTYVNVNTDLSWTGGDPDGDNVVYDVYFGIDPNPPNVANHQSNIIYDPGELENDTQYYWRIDAWDNFDNSTTDTTWTFRTALSGNSPPNKPSRPSGPTHGRIQISHSYQTSTTDSNLDQIYYMFDWDDGTNSGWMGPYESGQTVTASHVWSLRGSYGVKVKAKDSNDCESVWSDPLAISMPKSKAINSVFPRFLEQYPHLFPILKYLMNAME